LRLIRARSIVNGKAQGSVLFSSSPIAFLQGVDPEKGWVSDKMHELYSKPFAKRVLVFPNTVGSSVGAYVIYRLKRNGKAPIAIINQNSDIITASGCAIAAIPLFDLPRNQIQEFRNTKLLKIEDNGEITAFN
jgi:phosphomecalonate degydratase small subunit